MRGVHKDALFLSSLLVMFSLAFVTLHPSSGLTGRAAHPIHQGFSAAEPGFSVNGRQMSASDTAVYKTAYHAHEGDAGWTPFQLSGEPLPTDSSWIAGDATYTLPSVFEDPGEHYVIVYSCSFGGRWDCHGGRWQLHVISVDGPYAFREGFESGLQAPYLSVTGGGGIAVSSVYARSGSSSLRLSGVGTYHYTTPDSGVAGVVADLPGGGEVSYSVWVRGDSSVQAGLMVLCLNDDLNYWEDGGDGSGYEGLEVFAPGSWQQLSVSYSCPSWTRHVGVRLSVRGSGSAWFDDALLSVAGSDPCVPDCSGLACGPSRNACGSCGSCVSGSCVDGACSGGPAPAGDYVVVHRVDFEQHALGSYDHAELTQDWDLSSAWPYVIGNAAIVRDASDTINPSKVVRNFFPRGGQNCNDGACLQFSHSLDRGYDELYFTYRLKFGDGFSLGRGKLPRLGGMLTLGYAGKCTTGYDDFVALYEFAASNGDVQIKNYIYHALMWNATFYRDWYYGVYHDYPESCEEVCPITDEDEGGCGVYGEGSWFDPSYDSDKWTTFFDPDVRAGRWYSFTQRLVLNDIGTDNGFVETFIDGRLVNRITGLEFTKTDDLKIDNLLFSIYSSREPWPRDQYAYFDDIYLYYFTPASGEPLGHQFSSSGRVLPDVSGAESVTCDTHDHTDCYLGDVYWFDSCGRAESLVDDCRSNGCSGGVCVVQSDGCVSYDGVCGSGCSSVHDADCFAQEHSGFPVFALKDESDYASKVYIDPTYAGTSTGSLSQPYRSWRDVPWRSDTAYLQKRGTTASLDAMLTIPGTVSDIYLGGYGSGARPVISGSAQSRMFSIEAQRALFRGLDVRNPSFGAALYFRGNAVGGVVYDCVVRDVGHTGVFSWANGFKLLHSEIFDVYYDGLWVGNSEDVEIAHNRIYRVNKAWADYGDDQDQASGDAVQLQGVTDPSDSGVDRWWVHDNLFDRSDSGNKFCFHASGKEVDFGLFERNTLYGPSTDGHGGAGFYIGGYTDPVTGSWVMPRGVVVRDNLFFGPSPFGIWTEAYGLLVEGNGFQGQDVAIFNDGAGLRIVGNSFTGVGTCFMGGYDELSGNTGCS